MCTQHSINDSMWGNVRFDLEQPSSETGITPSPAILVSRFEPVSAQRFVQIWYDVNTSKIEFAKLKKMYYIDQHPHNNSIHTSECSSYERESDVNGTH